MEFNCNGSFSEGKCKSFFENLGKVITSTVLQYVKMKGNLKWKKQNQGLVHESLVLFCEWMGTWPVCTRWSRKEPAAFSQTQCFGDWDDDLMGNGKKTPIPPFSFRIIKRNNINFQCFLYSTPNASERTSYVLAHWDSENK